MAARVDINCDMGAGIGKFVPEHDADIMPLITSANIPAGYHGGDPHLMRATVELAIEHGVHVGVHPGLPDVIGGGTRVMDVTPQEMCDYVIYQLGALRAFCDQFDTPFKHVKPHGAMYRMLSDSEEHTRAVVEGILAVDPELIYVASDPHIYEVAKQYDIPTVLEAYPDMDYNPDGSVYTSLRQDAELIADRFVRIVTEGEVVDRNGDVIDIPARTVCIHGRELSSVAALEAIHERIDEHDIELTTLDQLV